MEKACPDWAETMLSQLLSLEVKLGNLPDDPKWQTRSGSDLLRSLESDDLIQVSDEIVDTTFCEIVRKLVAEDFTVRSIVNIINARVGYEGGPPYCNEEEVKEALV